MKIISVKEKNNNKSLLFNNSSSKTTATMSFSTHSVSCVVLCCVFDTFAAQKTIRCVCKLILNILNITSDISNNSDFLVPIYVLNISVMTTHYKLRVR